MRRTGIQRTASYECTCGSSGSAQAAVLAAEGCPGCGEPVSLRSRLKRTPLRRTGGMGIARDDKGPQELLCERLPCEACVAIEVATRYDDEDLTPMVVRVLLKFTTRVFVSSSVPHHVPTRNGGGKDKDAGPDCPRHHDEWHFKLGSRGYEAKYRINCRAIRAALAEYVKDHENATSIT